jgi:hypothetical protein
MDSTTDEKIEDAKQKKEKKDKKKNKSKDGLGETSEHTVASCTSMDSTTDEKIEDAKQKKEKKDKKKKDKKKDPTMKKQRLLAKEKSFRKKKKCSLSEKHLGKNEDLAKVMENLVLGEEDQAATSSEQVESPLSEVKHWHTLLEELTNDDDDMEQEATSLSPPMTPKTLRTSVAMDAARMGQLVRLSEHTVEAIAVEDDDDESLEDWNVNAISETEIVRSPFVQIINEAALLAQMKVKCEVVTNDTKEPEDDAPKEPEDDSKPKWRQRIVKIMEDRRQLAPLVEGYIKEQTVIKPETWDPKKLLEQQEKQKELRKSLTSEQLPTRRIPALQKKKFYMTKKQLRVCVAKEAAKASQNRDGRLQTYHRLKLRRKCKCKYCGNPTPLQTETYQRMRIRQFLLANDTKAYMGPATLIESEKTRTTQVATKIQAFVRGCQCRQGVQKMLTELIEALLAAHKKESGMDFHESFALGFQESFSLGFHDSFAPIY